MNSELKKIKKLYGEKFAHWCRDKFPTILSYEGRLLEILQNLFYPTKSLWEAMEGNKELQTQVMYRVFNYYRDNYPVDEAELDLGKSPEQLCDEAGYMLIKCETVEDVERFRKYYLPDEEICTYKNVAGRLNECFIFFAVKKGVDKIERGNPPQRDDEYGTSVMSLQFDKMTGRLKITNRYNHTVNGCDATLSNNLENIAPGLTCSFENYYGIKEVDGIGKLDIDNIVMDNSGRIYFYNDCVGKSVYYCEDNVVIRNGEPYYYDKDRFELIEYFLYDKDNETLIDLRHEDFPDKKEDGFVQTFKNVDKVDIVKDGQGNRVFKGTNKDGTTFEITVDRKNRIIAYKNDYLTECGSKFMARCTHLKSVEMENLVYMADRCFYYCRGLEKFYAPQLENAEELCFYDVRSLKEIYCPNLMFVGDHFCSRCDNLKRLDLPCLEQAGKECFGLCDSLEEINLPKLRIIGDRSFECASSLKKLSLESLQTIGNKCFEECDKLEEVSLPQLQQLSGYCFSQCPSLKKISLDNLLAMGNYCFSICGSLIEVNLPMLIIMLDNCFYDCMNLQEVDLPNLRKMGANCFYQTSVRKVNLPQLTTMFGYSFYIADSLEKISLPNMSNMSEHCFSSAKSLQEVSLPKLEILLFKCFEKCEKLKKIILSPKMKEKQFSMDDEFAQKYKNIVVCEEGDSDEDDGDEDDGDEMD